MIGRMLACYRVNIQLRGKLGTLKRRLCMAQKRLNMAKDLLEKNGIQYIITFSEEF